MEQTDYRALKNAACNALTDAEPQPRKLILLHTGIYLLLSLVLILVNFLLEQKIGQTGGLSGLGTRSILTTIQTVLQYVQILILPFWEAGYLFATLCWHRRRATGPATLTEGFRRFGPILRLSLLEGVYYFAIATGSAYLSSFLFMLSPWSDGFMESFEQMMTDPGFQDGNLTIDSFYSDVDILPILILFTVVFLIAAAPTFYRFRMTRYAILDGNRKGAFAAVRISTILMRKNRIALFKLDLSFWWFYLLDALVNMICYGDLLLPLLGVSPPWSASVNYLIVTLVYSICHLALYGWKRNQVQTTYAAVYDHLLAQHLPKA